MDLLTTRRALGWLLCVLPLLLANKECQRSVTWGDPYQDLAAAWELDHQDIDADTDCADCHDGVAKGKRPRSHGPDWLREHGGYASLKYGFRAQNVCALCHQESTCTACHQQEPPQDHTAFWRLRGHGLQMGLGRDRCAACHTTVDFCERCHAGTRPTDHSAQWGAPSNRHCTGCHFPIESAGAQRCAVCHTATPSHAAAPAQPDNALHGPAADCRGCHTPLRHVDNGMRCAACHL